jgi:hypothetical protein
MASKDFEQEYKAAARRAAKADAIEPRAKSARYDRRSRRIVVELRNGAEFMFPTDLAQGLAGADDEALSRIEVSASGGTLSWRDLDVDLSVPSLLAGMFGTRQWMRKIRESLATKKA